MYKLILVDDEKNILDGLSYLFPWDQIGFEVTGTFSDARQALLYLQIHEVDVVISDISMPHMNGIEFAKILSEQNGPRLIFISSYTDYEYFRNAIKYKVVDYLIKPIKYDQLTECLSTIRQQLDQAAGGKEEAVPPGYYEQIVQIVKEYLQANYRDATLAEAARRANLSPSYLSKVFKEKAGTSFSDTLLTIRMEKACELLSDIHYKSYEIAFDVGYDNPKNFSRAFKSYFNMSPTEYRFSKGK